MLDLLWIVLEGPSGRFVKHHSAKHRILPPRKSAEKQSPMVLELLKNLQECAVYTDSPNCETNRKLWNAYAQNWATDADWVKRMSNDVSKPANELSFVGDEWSDAESLAEVLKESRWKVEGVDQEIREDVWIKTPSSYRFTPSPYHNFCG